MGLILCVKRKNRSSLRAYASANKTHPNLPLKREGTNFPPSPNGEGGGGGGLIPSPPAGGDCQLFIALRIKSL